MRASGRMLPGRGRRVHQVTNQLTTVVGLGVRTSCRDRQSTTSSQDWPHKKHRATAIGPLIVGVLSFFGRESYDGHGGRVFQQTELVLPASVAHQIRAPALHTSTTIPPSIPNFLRPWFTWLPFACRELKEKSLTTQIKVACGEVALQASWSLVPGKISCGNVSYFPATQQASRRH